MRYPVEKEPQMDNFVLSREQGLVLSLNSIGRGNVKHLILVVNEQVLVIFEKKSVS